MSIPPQFSLRTALIAIAIFCVAVSGLTYANPLWASTWFTIIVGCLLVAGLAALFSRGSRRAFCTGFLLTGSIYLSSIYAPALDRRVGFWLLTTKSMFSLERQLDQLDHVESIFEPMIRSDRTELQAISLLSGGAQAGALPQWTSFQMVGHSIFALLLAWCGGLFAARLYEKDRMGSE